MGNHDTPCKLISSGTASLESKKLVLYPRLLVPWKFTFNVLPDVDSARSIRYKLKLVDVGITNGVNDNVTGVLSDEAEANVGLDHGL